MNVIITPEIAKQIEDMYDAGIRPVDIAKRFPKLNAHTLKNVAYRYGARKRRLRK